MASGAVFAVAPTIDSVALNASTAQAGDRLTVTTTITHGTESAISCLAYVSNTTSADATAVAVEPLGISNCSGEISVPNVTAGSKYVVINYTYTDAAPPASLYDSAAFTLTGPGSQPTVTYANVTDADTFYSPVEGYNIVHFRANASGGTIGAMRVNLTGQGGVSLVALNLSFNATSQYWEGTLNATPYIVSMKGNNTMNSSAPVSGYIAFITAYDSTNTTPSMPDNSTQVLLHDMGSFQGPPAGDPMAACMQEGTEADGQTNMSKIANFHAVNLVQVGYMNGSAACAYQLTGINRTMPWGEGNFKKMGMFNFTSVDMSTQEKAGAVMSSMGNVIRMQIAPPRSFAPSRIYVNSSNLTALNTSATITLYDLPFASDPDVVGDEGTGNITAVWTQKAYNTTFNATVGDLTITVGGFSGYNVTDSLAPEITIISPVNYYNSSASVLINYTVNGTGTEISFVRLAVYNYSNTSQLMVNYTYNATTDSDTGGSAQCSNATPGSEARNCYRSISLGGVTGLLNGNYLFNISAWDYGTPPAGNSQNLVQYFTLENTTPTVSLISPANESNLTGGNVTFQFNVTDVALSVSCTLFEDGSPTSSPFSATANGSAVSWNVSHPDDGSHTWLVNCTDGVGMSANSSAYVFLVDSHAPSVAPNDPASQYNTSLRNVTFSWTATDVFRSAILCNLTIDGAVNRSDIVVPNGTQYNTTATANFSQGVHTWSASCWDDLNNTNSSMASSTFTVDATAPLITPHSPLELANTSNRNVSLNWTAADALSTVIYCNLTIDGAVNRSSISVANGTAYAAYATSNFSDGSHNWSVACWDSANNTNSTMAAINFTVDGAAPTVVANSPANNSNTTNASVTFNFTAADVIANSTNCSLYINSALNQTNATSLNNTTTAFSATLQNGAYTWYVRCADAASNIGLSGTSALLVDTTGSGVLMVNNTTSVTTNTSVYVASNSPTSNISMSNASTNVTLNLANVYNSSTYTATIPSAINVAANTSLGTLQVEIPAATTVSGSADWSGTLNMPYIRSSASYAPTPASGYTASVTGVVEIGLPSVQLNFSNPIRIVVPGKAGAYVGFTREGAGSVTPITTVCNSATDSAAIASQLTGTTLECKVDSGSDLVIWTKHFTQFITYTQTAQSTSTAGNGGSGTSAGGNVGAGGGYTSSSQYASDYTLTIGGTSCTVHISRGIESSNSVSVLTTTLVNTGGEACTLSEFVFRDTVPLAFANTSEIKFSTQYSSQDGQAVSFAFPSFAPGESKTLTYSVSRWARTSSVSNFTDYLMSAKQPAPAAPAAQQPAATQPANGTPMPGPERDSHGCIPSAGYSWCEASGRCLRASEPCAAPPAAANAEPAQAAPEQQKQDISLPLILAAAGIVAMIALGAVALGLFKKHRKGL